MVVESSEYTIAVISDCLCTILEGKALIHTELLLSVQWKIYMDKQLINEAQ